MNDSENGASTLLVSLIEILMIVLVVLIVLALLGVLSDRLRLRLAGTCLLLAALSLARDAQVSSPDLFTAAGAFYLLAVVLWLRPSRKWRHPPSESSLRALAKWRKR
jgi:chromate transport protein ChrA